MGFQYGTDVSDARIIFLAVPGGTGFLIVVEREM